MMNKIMKRLKSKAGETLVESMAAILIFTFGSIIMLSMVSAAADINATAKEMDKTHTNQMAIVEKGEGAGVNGKLTFTYGSVSTKTEKASVAVYSDDASGSLYAYYPVIVDDNATEGGQAS